MWALTAAAFSAASWRRSASVIVIVLAMALQAFRTNKYVDAAFYTPHPASTGLIAAAGWSVFALVLRTLTLTAPRISLPTFFNGKT